MSKVTSFEELWVWQLSRELAKEIYSLIRRETFSKDFELKNQINKSAGSSMDTIAEGFERGGTKEFTQFLSVAKGSYLKNSEMKGAKYANEPEASYGAINIEQ